MTSYIFDGTFFGLLTAIFESYERKQKLVRVFTCGTFSGDMFNACISVETNTNKALRVWRGLSGKLSHENKLNFYTAWHADQITSWQLMFNYAQYIFDHPIGMDQNYGHELVSGLSDIAKKVSREGHRMKAFTRFQKGANQLFYAVVCPDYNVLPLIATHFKQRYADQHWVIYDQRRKYGLHYDLLQVQEVTFEYVSLDTDTLPEDIILDEHETLYSTLWKDYFNSTNIKERKNMKLHIQHVPRRYWRYLTEKDMVV